MSHTRPRKGFGTPTCTSWRAFLCALDVMVDRSVSIVVHCWNSWALPGSACSDRSNAGLDRGEPYTFGAGRGRGASEDVEGHALVSDEGDDTQGVILADDWEGLIGTALRSNGDDVVGCWLRPRGIRFGEPLLLVTVRRERVGVMGKGCIKSTGGCVALLAGEPFVPWLSIDERDGLFWTWSSLPSSRLGISSDIASKTWSICRGCVMESSPKDDVDTGEVGSTFLVGVDCMSLSMNVVGRK